MVRSEGAAFSRRFEYRKTSPFISLFISAILMAYLTKPAHAQWAYTYGGISSEHGQSVQQTQDGGYIVVGWTMSFGGGSEDFWVLKLEEDGRVVWQKAYGRQDYTDRPYSIQQTSDGGYVVAGGTWSGFVLEGGPSGIWVLKLDGNGNVQWQKSYDGGTAQSIQQTSDGGYIVASSTRLGAGIFDLWILKLDSSGNVLWQKAYGGSQIDYAYSVRQSSDGGYIVAGSTESFGAGPSDIWILKLDGSGNVLWQKRYGGTGSESPASVQQTSDGGYIVAGNTSSFGSGIWILKLNSSGNVTWQKLYEGLNTRSIEQTSDGGYVVAGHYLGALILKLDSSGNVMWQRIYGGSELDEAESIRQTTDGGYIVAGVTASFGEGASATDNFLVLKLDSNGEIPGCPFQWSSNAVVKDTTISPIDTNATVTITTVTPQTTIATVTDTTVTPEVVCTAAPSAPILSVERVGTGSGKVTSNPSGIDCGGDCSEYYGTGTKVTLTATPDPESFFAGWTGDGDCSDGQVTMDADQACLAIFNLVTGGLYSQWANTYGGTNSETMNAIEQTSDGGYILTGSTKSFGAGDSDFWVLKLDSSSNLLWQKAYGGKKSDFAESIRQTLDGGYIVAGGTTSFGAGNQDFWILKLDTGGDVLWQKTYGGEGDERAQSIRQTSDGGYVVSGFKDFSTATGLESNFWVLKLDPSGNAVWQKAYGGSEGELFPYIEPTSDGGYVLAGQTGSFSAGMFDFWVLKLDSTGNILWQKSYGGLANEYLNSIQQTSDGGYIVAGFTGSFGGGGDFWILKLDSSGNIQWQKRYGSLQEEFEATSIRQTSDGGYVVAGVTPSRVTGSWAWDFWVLKIDSNGDVQWQRTYGGPGFDAFPHIQQTSDGGYVVAGTTYSFGAGESDILVLKVDRSGNIGGCSVVGSSDVIVNDTTITPVHSNATVTPTDVTPKTSNATVTNTTVTPGMVCRAYTLTVIGEGNGSGTVSSSPGGIHCGLDCVESYDAGRVVTLTATPDTGSLFAGWSGDPDCSDGSVTMTENRSCTAAFSLKEYRLTVVKAGTGDGAVTSTPKGINCGSDCSETYTKVQKVNLTAKTNKDSTFGGWSGGGCTGTGPCQVTVDSAITITASFALKLPDISVDRTSLEFGDVKVKKSLKKTVKITNNGPGNLTVTLAGPAGTEFQMVGKSSITVKPKKTYPLNITFKPTSTGEKAATLTLTSNDPDRATINIPLSGVGM